MFCLPQLSDAKFVSYFVVAFQLMQKQFVVLKLEHLENVMSKILKQQEKNSEDLKSLNTSFVNTISNIEKRIQAQETSIASVLEKIDDQVLSQSEDLKKCFLSEYQRLYSDSNVQYNSLSEKLKMVWMRALPWVSLN